MQCLVLGGKGFIGSHLVNFLKENGHWVRSVDVKPNSLMPTNEDEFLYGDLRDPEVCRAACTGIDYVYQLAANMGGIGYITELNAPIMRDNALINIHVLEACRLADVKRVFFSSSACTYNRELQQTPDAPPLSEVDIIPAHPDSAYGWEKLFSEILYESYANDYGLDVRIARFHNVYGTHCVYDGGHEKAPAAICRKVIQNKDSIPVWGDGKQRRSFLYVTDCLEGIDLLMRSSFSHAVNLGSDESISINGLAELVMKIAGKKMFIINLKDKPQGVRGRNCDLTLARKIGFDPKVSLKTGMAALYHYVYSDVMGEPPILSHG